MSSSARLEIYHSRPVVPTRRIALGDCDLDDTRVDLEHSDLTLGGLLLAAVVGRYSSGIHPDLWDDMEILIERIAANRHISQPYLRFRLQQDKAGLAKSEHTIVMNTDGEFDLYFGVPGQSNVSSALQQLLGALYAARLLESDARAACISAVKTALGWWGTNTDSLLNYILDSHSGDARRYPRTWALRLLGINSINPTGAEIQRHFRQKLWSVHPDRGGDPETASEHINNLAEARRQLLAAEMNLS